MLEKNLKIGNIVLSNRIVMPPMATGKTTALNHVTQELVDYYNEKTNGGFIGLLITEHSYINISGRASFDQVSISKDSDIEGLKQIVDVVHKNNTPIICQISHAGGASTREIAEGEIYSSSPVAHPFNRKGEIPKELSISEIEQIKNDFISASIRAQKAGFDGVELHSAHAYLLNQFYSPIINKREDMYGPSSIENRLRLHIEIINGIREKLGKSFIIGVRLGGSDYLENGSTVCDALKASKLLEVSGVDFIDISGGMRGFTNGHKEAGYFKDVSTIVKENIQIPVIMTGGVKTREQVEELLANKACDAVGVGRALLKDSLWAKKALNE